MSDVGTAHWGWEGCPFSWDRTKAPWENLHDLHQFLEAQISQGCTVDFNMFLWAAFEHIPNANPQFRGCSTIFWGADQKSLVFSPIFPSLVSLNPNPPFFLLAESCIKDVIAVLTKRWLFNRRFTQFCLEGCEWSSSPRKSADFPVNRIGKDLHSCNHYCGYFHS